jgi:hypothetical protein
MELKTTLNEEMTKRFQAVKEHNGMSSDKEILNTLISKEFHRIERLKLHKVFLPKETYDLAEKTAKARGQTIDEYIDEMTEKLLKEGVKHGN